jgi:hypothetical protein
MLFVENADKNLYMVAMAQYQILKDYIGDNKPEAGPASLLDVLAHPP